MQQIVIICGPTASGKSYLGHKIAKEYGTEIINIDSMQVYREIPIITASPSQSNKSEIPYHLYNFLSITEDFSVIKYLQYVNDKINEITNRNKQIIIIGGTGLYINLLLYGYNHIPDIESNLKQEVRNIYTKIGVIEFAKRLKALDPLSSRIKENDSQRLIRAYEIFAQTGKSIYFFQDLPKKQLFTEYNFKVIFLNPKRDFLYNNCNKRLEQIFDKGIDEVLSQKDKLCNSSSLALKAIGIKEILAYLNKDISYTQALNLAQTRTRQYAKRQITWFKNQLLQKTILEYENEEELMKIKLMI